MHWPQYIVMATWWGSILVSGGRFAWSHWHQPRPPGPPPELPNHPVEPDYYDYIEDRYRDQ